METKFGLYLIAKVIKPSLKIRVKFLVKVEFWFPKFAPLENYPLIQGSNPNIDPMENGEKLRIKKLGKKMGDLAGGHEK